MPLLEDLRYQGELGFYLRDTEKLAKAHANKLFEMKTKLDDTSGSYGQHALQQGELTEGRHSNPGVRRQRTESETAVVAEEMGRKVDLAEKGSLGLFGFQKRGRRGKNEKPLPGFQPAELG